MCALQKAFARLTWIIVFTQILNSTLIAKESFQDECERALEIAEQQYFEGHFDDAIALLNRCLNKGAFSGNNLINAYKILAECYISKSELDQARNFVKKMLEEFPYYQPDKEKDSLILIELVEEIKQQKIKKEEPEQKPETEIVQKPDIKRKKGNKVFLWIGVGAAAIGGGVVAALRGGGNGGGTTNGPERLPDPPGEPGSN